MNNVAKRTVVVGGAGGAANNAVVINTARALAVRRRNELIGQDKPFLMAYWTPKMAQECLQHMDLQDQTEAMQLPKLELICTGLDWHD